MSLLLRDNLNFEVIEMKKWIKTASFKDHQTQYIDFISLDSTTGIKQFTITKCADEEHVTIKIIGRQDTIEETVIECFNRTPDFTKTPSTIEPGQTIYELSGSYNVEFAILRISAHAYLCKQDRCDISEVFGFINILSATNQKMEEHLTVALARKGYSLSFLTEFATKDLAHKNGESNLVFSLAQYYEEIGDLFSAIKLYVLLPEDNEQYKIAHKSAYDLINNISAAPFPTLSEPELACLEELKAIHLNPAYRWSGLD